MHHKDFLVTLQNMSLRSSFGLIHDATASQKNIKSCNKQEIHLRLIFVKYTEKICKLQSNIMIES